ncbi:ArsR/SmtB family transcription factor [Natrinema soli]|uniref:ArsR/SmtB family transcription factor n=1 Tax=Natrinema soli TaxID=1930624 RepID=A0ABD5SX29_9EURY|nr:winged helix-turn-helix domain-containing protein [Natrinema soli]
MTDDEERELLALLDDEYARRILIAASEEPMSVERLTECCDASPPTIYRRIDRLTAAGYLDEYQELDPDGHHYKTYSTRLERVAIEIAEGSMALDVYRLDEDPADRFTRLFEDL